LAKEKLTTEEINKFLVDTDHESMTVWHVAARLDKLEILQKYGNGLKRI